jgi:tRNA 2-selenouridine synthase
MPGSHHRQPSALLRADFEYADLKRFDAVIDVRSPAEYAEDHIPGAINCPVLDDAERAQVGIVYKQQSAFDAKKLGAAIVARNIAAHLDNNFRCNAKGWKPLIYCWRGGSRSGAMTHILRSVGWHALQLEGGYKSFRARVIRDLETLPARFTYRVICGRTGSGKSRLLEALAVAGAQVLDLEQLAAHRGSVLGDLPGAPQPTQKTFESLIWEQLHRSDPARPLFVEAESKKVGMLRVPQSLIERMWEGQCLQLDVPEAARIELLRDEYAHLIHDTPLLFAKLDCLNSLHSRERIDAWKTLARAGRWDEFVADMLKNHYDPAYGKSMFRNYRHAELAQHLEVRDISPGGFARLAEGLVKPVATTDEHG